MKASLKKLLANALTSFVKKSGDTISGELNYSNPNIDAKQSNNGVSSGTIWPTTFNITDKARRILARLEATINSNGNIGAYWYIRNYDTSGNQVGQKGISMTMDKSGNLTYSVSDASKFRNAINAQSTLEAKTFTSAPDRFNGSVNFQFTKPANYRPILLGYCFVSGDASVYFTDINIVSYSDAGTSIILNAYIKNPSYANVMCVFNVLFMRID